MGTPRSSSGTQIAADGLFHAHQLGLIVGEDGMLPQAAAAIHAVVRKSLAQLLLGESGCFANGFGFIQTAKDENPVPQRSGNVFRRLVKPLRVVVEVDLLLMARCLHGRGTRSNPRGMELPQANGSERVHDGFCER